MSAEVIIPTIPMPESKEVIDLEKRHKRYYRLAKFSFFFPPAVIMFLLMSYSAKKQAVNVSTIGSRANVNCPHCNKGLEFMINSNYMILTCTHCSNKFYVKK